MADSQGGFGFLDQITDVQFGGGPWLWFKLFWAADDPVELSFEFIEQKKGTPGVLMVSGGVAHVPPLVAAPFGGDGVTVTSAYLKQVAHTAAGSTIIGWGTRNAILGNSGGSSVFLQSGTGSGLLPSNKKSRIRMRTSGGPNTKIVQVRWIKETDMKPAAVTPIPSSDHFAQMLIGDKGTLDATVDPKNLTADVA